MVEFNCCLYSNSIKNHSVKQICTKIDTINCFHRNIYIFPRTIITINGNTQHNCKTNSLYSYKSYLTYSSEARCSTLASHNYHSKLHAHSHVRLILLFKKSTVHMFTPEVNALWVASSSRRRRGTRSWSASSAWRNPYAHGTWSPRSCPVLRINSGWTHRHALAALRSICENRW